MTGILKTRTAPSCTDYSDADNKKHPGWKCHHFYTSQLKFACLFFILAQLSISFYWEIRNIWELLFKTSCPWSKISLWTPELMKCNKKFSKRLVNEVRCFKRNKLFLGHIVISTDNSSGCKGGRGKMMLWKKRNKICWHATHLLFALFPKKPLMYFLALY